MDEIDDKDDLESADNQRPDRSELSREISEIQQTVCRLARERERVPQPLFWSVLSDRLRRLRRRKKRERSLTEIFNA